MSTREHAHDRESPGGDVVTALLDALQAVADGSDAAELLRAVARKTARASGVSHCSILFRQYDHLWPVVTQSSSGAPLAALCRRFSGMGPFDLADMPALREAVERGGPVIVHRPDTGRRLPAEWVDVFGSASVAVIPLLHRAELAGALVLDAATGLVRADHLWPAEVVARHLSLAIDRVRTAFVTSRRFAENNRLLRVALAIGSTLDREEVLRRIAREFARAAGADTSGIYLVGDDDHALRPLVGYHVPKALLEVVQRGGLKLDDFRPLVAAFDDERSSIWSDDVPRDPLFDHAIFRALGMRSAFITVLRAGSRVFGVLACAWWTQQARFDPGLLSLLEGIARLAAVAIANARQYSEAATAAIHEERARVARELHDALNRTVFSAALKLDACLRELPVGAAGLEERLKDVKRDTGTIMQAIRELIHELAPPPAGVAGLSDRLRATLDDARALSDIQFDLAECGDLGRLRPNQQDALFKVVQEALANVVKHSSASRARVAIRIAAGEVRFDVTDDGMGAPAALTVERLPHLQGHFGLRQALDRLHGIGGDLAFENLHPSGFRLTGGFPIGG